VSESEAPLVEQALSLRVGRFSGLVRVVILECSIGLVQGTEIVNGVRECRVCDEERVRECRVCDESVESV
jgi:hypothetical protein